MKKQTLDCVIIGGGIAGLSSAYTLKNKKFLILDENNYLGGRTHCEKQINFTMERGAVYLLFMGHRAKNLLKELKLEKKIEKINKKVGFFYNKKLHELKVNNPLEIIHSFIKFKIIKKNVQNVVNFIKLYLESIQTFTRVTSSYKNLKEQDSESGEKWLKKYFDSQIINKIFEPISETFLFSKTKKISSTIMKVVLGAFFHFTNPIYIIKGGIYTISKNLEKSLPNYSFRLNEKVTEIRRIKKGFSIKSENGTTYICKSVISAIPIPNLIKIKKNFVLENLSAVEYKKIISINLGIKHTIEEFKGHHIIFLESSKDRPLVLVGDMQNKSSSLSNKTSILYMIISSEYSEYYFDKKDNELYDIIYNQLEEIFPKFRKDSILVKNISRWENAFCLVNKKYFKFDNVKTKVPGFFICGDSILPGIDGVIESGLDAGNFSLNYLDESN